MVQQSKKRKKKLDPWNDSLKIKRELLKEKEAFNRGWNNAILYLLNVQGHSIQLSQDSAFDGHDYYTKRFDLSGKRHRRYDELRLLLSLEERLTLYGKL